MSMSTCDLPGVDALTDSTSYKLYRTLKREHVGAHILFREENHCNPFQIIEYLMEIGTLPKDLLLNSRTLQEHGESTFAQVKWHEGGFKKNSKDSFIHFYEAQEEASALGFGNAETGYSSFRVINSSLNIKYKGVDMKLYKYTYRHFYDQYDATFLVWHDTDHGDAIGRQLFDDVLRWERRLKDEVWMFDEGWSKNKDLYGAIKETKIDDIVLPNNVLPNLLEDARTFFEHREAFKEANVAWKRGILLLGPPGNGKTNTIRALLQRNIDRPILYVKSFQMGRMRTPERGVRMVFTKARAVAPCILVMEDLDALVNDDIRSFVLNEMDGLESNDGILMIGSTNHPERLDDSFAKRPSRFDRKYQFDCPDVACRERYARHWLTTRITSPFMFGTKQEEAIQTICEKSQGWSFAFLQEVFVIYMMRSVRARLQSGQDKLDETTLFELLVSILDDMNVQRST